MKLDIMRFIYSGLLIRFNTDYKKISEYDSEQFLEFQGEMLKNLLSHSVNNVPYYNNISRDINLEFLDNFCEIPILTKEIIRQNFKSIISQDYKKRNWFYHSSGGSTGEPLKIILDDQTIKWGNIGHYYWCRNMLNIDEPRVKKILLWGNERDIFGEKNSLKDNFYKHITKSLTLNSFRMTQDNIEYYINKINSFKPEFIRGYASSLYELCKFAEKRNLEIYTPKIIESTSENLKDEMRDKIESVFGTKIFDFYGSREVSSMAGECNEGSLHIFNFKNYIEILDKKNKPVKPGKEGKVIVTDLSNYAMPLIRYEIGDLAVLGNKKCTCGNPLPTLKKVIGRITDHFILKDGTTIPAEYFIHIVGAVLFKGTIKKFQLIQKDYDLIIFKVVLNSEMQHSEKNNLENKIRLVMGKRCKIKWDYVEEIPKTQSGKYLYTKSLLI